MGTPELSVVIPSYNEAGALPSTLAELCGVLDEAALDAEVVVVDDDSPDRTWAVAERLSAGLPVAVMRRRGAPRGLAASVLDGLAACSAPVVAVMDADGQHDPAVVPELVRQVAEEGFDVCVGVRRVVPGGLHRQALTAAGAAAIGVMLPPARAVPDPTSGMFAARREVFDAAAAAYGHIPPGRSFKVLWRVLGAARSVSCAEYEFRPRSADRSALSARVAASDLCVGLRLGAAQRSAARRGAPRGPRQ